MFYFERSELLDDLFIDVETSKSFFDEFKCGKTDGDGFIIETQRRKSSFEFVSIRFDFDDEFDRRLSLTRRKCFVRST